MKGARRADAEGLSKRAECPSTGSGRLTAGQPFKKHDDCERRGVIEACLAYHLSEAAVAAEVFEASPELIY
jgi:hypothetical protein